MTEHIELVRNATRLTITPDAEPLNPRTDIQTPVGFFMPTIGWQERGAPPAIYAFPGNLDLAHDRLWDWDRPLDPEHVITRWAWCMYNTVLVHKGSGYWFCDRTTWDNIIGTEWTAENQRAVIDQEIHAWERYRQGAACIVTLERRATFKRITRSRVDESDLLHVWEKVDDIGDIYVEDYNGSYIQVAADHFAHEFTKRERAVMTAALDSERVLSNG